MAESNGDEDGKTEVTPSVDSEAGNHVAPARQEDDDEWEPFVLTRKLRLPKPKPSGE